MTEQAIAIASPEPIAFAPQDHRARLTARRLASVTLSLLVLAASLYQLRTLNVAEIERLVPSSPLFWTVFAISYLAAPFSDWVIFRHLWDVGPKAFGALTRKLIYNELLVGYLGEVYFYTWARQRLPLAASPFGAVKDVAVLSAIAGNVVTLALLALAFPVIRMLPVHDHATTIAWSLAFVIGTSLAAMLWRGRIFSLGRGDLALVALVHFLRIFAIVGLSALLWHLAMPATPLVWWLVLATLRLLISRLPFVPNKDLVFAGVAAFVVGQQEQIAALMAMMAAIILFTHMLVGVTFALADLAKGGRDGEAAG